MTIMLRRCGPDDAPALSLIGQATFLESYAGIIPGTDILAHCARQHAVSLYDDWLAAPKAPLWLAELDGAPIGYAGLAAPDLPVAIDASDVELKRIYVFSKFQAQKVGYQLMEAASAEARTLGFGRVLLGVAKFNTRALAFYQRSGFAIVGERRFEVGANVYDDHVMARAL